MLGPNLANMTTYRTPQSLNWLLDNYRRIAGQIQAVEKKLEYFSRKYAKAKIIVDQHDHHLPRVLRSLKSDLKALDQTIGMHHIAIDLDLVSPIREQTRRPRYGNMTPSIYACFSVAPREWKTTNEIAAFVTSKRSPSIRDHHFPYYRDAVNRHLKAMLKRGQVEKMTAKGLRKESLWRCADPKVVTSLVVQTDVDCPDSSHETTETNQPER